jgi:hypothetical protein
LQIPAPANIGTSNPAVSGPGDFQLQSGFGRLDEILPLQRFTSGVTTPLVFYDAAVATSGGPYPLSGHKILAVIPSTAPGIWSGGMAVASGTFGALSPPVLTPAVVGMPFQSGLCVNLRSGQAPFTVTFSPEVPSIF